MASMRDLVTLMVTAYDEMVTAYGYGGGTLEPGWRRDAYGHSLRRDGGIIIMIIIIIIIILVITRILVMLNDSWTKCRSLNDTGGKQ